MFYIENIDATIIAQAPKMRPHIDKMRENIARALCINIDQVNVKATTEEGLGFTGEGKGISAQAICMLTSPREMATMETRNTSYMNSTGCENCPGCRAK
jgi:2-C-methyl-D-erythritol 2,4-cyclodiphosphate synthase